MTHKTCAACGREKPLDEFHRMRSADDGRQRRCKDCQKHAVYSGRGSIPVPEDLGHIYLVLFASGRVKLGHAKNPDHRISTHVYNGACLGNAVLRTWISPRVPDSGSVEQLALAEVRPLASSVFKREWFDGVDFDIAVDRIRELTTKEHNA